MMREAQASIFLSETFDYTSQAALAAVWNASGGDNTTYHFDTGVGNPIPSYKMPSPAANFSGTQLRLGRNIGVVNGTDTNPLHLTFDLLLDSGGDLQNWSGARDIVELRGYENGAFNDGALTSLVAAGVFNTSFDTFDTQYYQGRARFGSPNDWITLDSEPGAKKRSTGWHTLDIEIRSSDVRFSIDGVLAEVAPRQNNLPFDSVLLGSGLTANGRSAWIDNIRVADSDTGVVPEATSVLIWGLLGLTLAVGSSHRRYFSP
jgi:hypothetical protein